MGRSLCGLVAAALLVACGGEESDGTAPPVIEPPVEPPVLTPGPSDSFACPAGELEVAGTCQPAGIADCGNGFEPSPDDEGCVPILPATACDPGMMAVPGETSCRPIAPCGSGIWGDVATDSMTQHVDASFVGASDGSSTAPWTTIQEAIDAAADGATVAIAAGSYSEDLNIGGKAVTLWGVCPEQVEVVGVGGAQAAVWIQNAPAGIELRGFAVTSPNYGVVIAGATDVLLDKVWIHDSGARTLDVEPGPTSVTVRDSLLEKGVGEGIYALGSRVTVESSVIRQTDEESSGLWGRGIGTNASGNNGPAIIEVRDSVIEDNHDAGLAVLSSELTMERTVVRENRFNSADGVGGYGLWMPLQTGFTLRSSGVIRQTVFDHNTNSGVVVTGSDLEMENTTIRRTTGGPAMSSFGEAMGITAKPQTGDRSHAVIRSSAIVNNRAVGIYNLGADVEVYTTVIADTQPASQSWPALGRAIGAEVRVDTGGAATLLVSGCRLERNHENGVFLAGSTGTVEHTLIRDTMPQVLDGRHGRGITAQADLDFPELLTHVDINHVLVDNVYDVGIVALSATVNIEESTVRHVLPRSDGWMGRGLALIPNPGGMPLEATVRRSLIDDTYDTGVFITAGTVRLEDSIVRGNKKREVDGLLGDGIAIVGSGPTQLIVARSLIEGHARAGISGFSASVGLSETQLECNGFDLAGDATAGSFDFSDDGGNVCGCQGEVDTCKLSSANIEAPPPPE